jgi:hypothetical protein
MKNLNAYDADSFKVTFQTMPMFKQVSNDFENLSWDKHFNFRKAPRDLSYRMNSEQTSTPREIMAPYAFSVVPFYYLAKLVEQSPELIYDIGCGWNIFKKYIPNIVGVAGETVDDQYYAGDLHDFVDDDYIKLHQDCFESAFSINAIHFVPLKDFTSRVQGFVSMIQPGGRGFLAMNIEKMLDKKDSWNSTTEALEFLTSTFGTTTPKVADLDSYVRNELSTMACNYLIFDVDLSDFRNYMDGNIRIVFER